MKWFVVIWQDLNAPKYCAPLYANVPAENAAAAIGYVKKDIASNRDVRIYGVEEVTAELKEKVNANCKELLAEKERLQQMINAIDLMHRVL